MPCGAEKLWAAPFASKRAAFFVPAAGPERKRRKRMKETETRIAVVGIIVEDKDAAEQVNALLHQYGAYIIGRMGLPYEKKQVNIISVVLDAPGDIISALSGKLGRLPGVSSKALYTKAGEREMGAAGDKA